MALIVCVIIFVTITLQRKVLRHARLDYDGLGKILVIQHIATHVYSYHNGNNENYEKTVPVQPLLTYISLFTIVLYVFYCYIFLLHIFTPFSTFHFQTISNNLRKVRAVYEHALTQRFGVIG